MKFIPLTKGYVALVDDEDFEMLSQWKWHAALRCNKPYATRSIWDSKNKRTITIIMHREILKAPKDKFVDHKNGDTLNNQRSNIRLCTRAENQRNRRPNKGSTSKYLGVYWDKRKSKWCMGINGRREGYFNDEQEAARAYDAVASVLFKEFAHLNFPPSTLLQ